MAPGGRRREPPLKPRTRRRWFSEFGVIVLGVLVALGVDDARQFIADRVREQGLLLRMASDLEADGEDLAATYSLAKQRLWLYNELIEEGGATAAVFPESGPELRAVLEARASSSPSWDSINSPLSNFIFFPDFDLSDDSYREMLSTGTLGTIRDTKLRSRILEYYRVAEDRGADARWAAGHHEQFRAALFTQDIAVGDVISLRELRERLQGESMQTELRQARARTLVLLFFLERIAEARRGLLEAIEAGSSS